jgi:hypothetical protein
VSSRSAASFCLDLLIVLRKAAHALAVAAMLAVFPLAASEFDPVVRPEEQLLILAVDLGRGNIHEGITVYVDGGDLLVPLLMLCEVLEIPVEGSVEEGVAKGWFRDPSRGFVLDMGRRLLAVEGREMSAEWGRLERHEDDIYVPLSAFKLWFDLEIEPQLRMSRLLLPEGQGLAVELRRERDRRWRSHERTRTGVLPREEPMPYRAPWLEWPTIDLSFGGDLSSDGAAMRADMVAQGAMLRSEARLSLNARLYDDGRSDTDLRLRFQRRFDNVDSLGWSVGDLFVNAIPAALPVMEGAGFSLGNWDESDVQGLLSTALRGDALSGWDVELYRDDELLDFVRVGDDNVYRFEAVPLVPGLNVFRIVLYGPDGQRQEDLRKVLVGEGALPAGSRRWRAYWLWPRKRVFDIGATRSEQDVPPIFGLGYTHALSTHWGVAADLIAADPLDDHETLLSLRLRGGFSGVLSEAQLLVDGAGRRGSRAALQLIGERSDAVIEMQRSSGIWSPARDPRYAGEIVDEAIRARLNSRWVRGWPITIDVSQQKFAASGAKDQWRRRVASMRIARSWLGWDTAMQYELSQDGGSILQRRINGILSYRKSGWDIGGQWSFDVSPQRLLRIVQFGAGWTGQSGLRLRSSLIRQRNGSSATDEWRDRVEVGMGLRTSRWSFGISGAHGRNEGNRFAFTMSTSLQRTHSGWRADSRPGAATATVEARVFLDADGDGIYDSGEVPLQGVTFSSGFGQQAINSDVEGWARLERLPANQPVSIRLRGETLGDPFRFPLHESRVVKLPPGAVIRLDYPVVVSSEIDGMVYLETSVGRREASNVALEAISADGRVFRTSTAFDGAYLFERLPPGSYTLRVASDQLQRLGLCAPGDRSVSLAHDDEGHVATVDLVLRKRGSADAGSEKDACQVPRAD